MSTSGVIPSMEETRGLITNTLPPPKLNRLIPTWFCFALQFAVGYFITLSTNYLYVFIDATGRDTEEAEYLYVFYFLSLILGLLVGFMIESPRLVFRIFLPLAIITATYWPFNTSYVMLCIIIFISGFVVAAIETPGFVEVRLIWSSVDASDESEIQNKTFYLTAAGIAIGLGTVGPIITAEISNKSVYAFGFTLAALWIIPYVFYMILYLYPDEMDYMIDTDKLILKKKEGIVSVLSSASSEKEEKTCWEIITSFYNKFSIDIYISLCACLGFSSWMVISVFMEDAYEDTFSISTSNTEIAFNLFVYGSFAFRQIIFPGIMSMVTDLDVAWGFPVILLVICIIISLVVLVFDASDFPDMTVPVMIYTTTYGVIIPPSICLVALSGLITDHNIKYRRAKLEDAEIGIESEAEAEDDRTGVFIVLLGIYMGWGGAAFVYDGLYYLSPNGDGIFFNVALYIWMPLISMCMSLILMVYIYMYAIERDVKEVQSN